MNEIVLTLDTDWAPDFIIDFVAAELAVRGVRATWFVTHASPAIDRLRSRPELFELGIHPNFMSGSTHGDEPRAVLNHCMEIVPEAVSMRTHGLLQSTNLFEQVLAHTPIRADVSLFLPYAPHLRPLEYHWRGRALTRVPFFWEDDFEMERARPRWELSHLLAVGDGLKVFDFHPVHVYLNSAGLDSYQALKRAIPRLQEVSQAEAAPFVNRGAGTRALFTELIEHLAAAGSCRIADVTALASADAGRSG
jgi:hypothetical protein